MSKLTANELLDQVNLLNSAVQTLSDEFWKLDYRQEHVWEDVRAVVTTFWTAAERPLVALLDMEQES